MYIITIVESVAIGFDAGDDMACVMRYLHLLYQIYTFRIHIQMFCGAPCPYKCHG